MDKKSKRVVAKEELPKNVIVIDDTQLAPRARFELLAETVHLRVISSGGWKVFLRMGMDSRIVKCYYKYKTAKSCTFTKVGDKCKYIESEGATLTSGKELWLQSTNSINQKTSAGMSGSVSSSGGVEGIGSITSSVTTNIEKSIDFGASFMYAIRTLQSHQHTVGTSSEHEWNLQPNKRINVLQLHFLCAGYDLQMKAVIPQVVTIDDPLNLPFMVEPGSRAEEEDSDQQPQAAAAKQCKAMSSCLTDQDCGGGGVQSTNLSESTNSSESDANNKTNNMNTPIQPRCRGALVNRCDCSACSIGKVCSNDTACGGLRTACHNGFCNCLQAAQTLYDALDPAVRPNTQVLGLVEACNKVVCNSTPDACFGLPCRKGYCICT